MPGIPGGMPPPVAKPPAKFEPSKPKLPKMDTKAFGWKRVIIDRNGLGTGPDKKPATYEVVDAGMRKLDNNYKGLKVIWIDIEEDKKITHAEINELFKEKKKAAPANLGQVAAVVNKKKSQFTDKAQNLQIMLSRMPDADTVITAVTKLKIMSFNAEKIQTLITNWPADEMDDLLAAAEEDGDNLSNWEKPEQFFIKVGRERKFNVRLEVWKFKIDFPEKVKLAAMQQKQLLDGFNIVLTNKRLHNLLGKILTIGNYMNAADAKKGQADGYILADVFNKVTSMRDVNNESILKLVCKKMAAEDPEFVSQFKAEFEECYNAKKCVIDDITKQVGKCKGEAAKAMTSYEMLMKQVPHLADQPFGKQIGAFLKGTDA